VAGHLRHSDLDATNARIEGVNHIINQTTRVGCGYRHMDDYRRRILSRIAITERGVLP
jgi:transposase